MLKVISSLQEVTRSKECMVTFSKTGRHIFGGELTNLSFSGLPLSRPLHNFLTIDTSDKNSPITFQGGEYLPLLYPLSYSDDGGYISYRMIGDLEVEITSLPEAKDENFFPEFLPVRKARLSPLTYAERRILHSDVRDPSPSDRCRLKKLWNREFFKVSGMIDYYPNRFECLNPKKGVNHCSAWKIAEFPATQVPFGDIWGAFSSDNGFIFSFCFECNQIHGHFECT
jgi:hypothetical protein